MDPRVTLTVVSTKLCHYISLPFFNSESTDSPRVFQFKLLRMRVSKTKITYTRGPVVRTLREANTWSGKRGRTHQAERFREDFLVKKH